MFDHAITTRGVSTRRTVSCLAELTLTTLLKPKRQRFHLLPRHRRVTFRPLSFTLLSVGCNGEYQRSIHVVVVVDHITPIGFCRNQREMSRVCLTIVVKVDDGVIRLEHSSAFMLDLPFRDDVGKRMKLKNLVVFIILMLWYHIHIFILIGPPRVVVDLYACKEALRQDSHQLVGTD